eukprot:2562441-Pyramimonas_sp.AAC.2
MRLRPRASDLVRTQQSARSHTVETRRSLEKCTNQSDPAPPTCTQGSTRGTGPSYTHNASLTVPSFQEHG